MYAQSYRDADGYNNGTIRPMEDIGMPKWDLTLTLLFSWIIIYLCVLKGKTTPKQYNRSHINWTKILISPY